MPLLEFAAIPNHRLSRSLCYLYSLLMVLSTIWIFAVAEAAAQSPTTSVTPTPASPEKVVTPIAIQDILSSAYAQQKRLDVAKKLLNAADPVIPLRTKLDDIASHVDRQLSTTSESALHELPTMRLESLARHLKFHTKLLERWEIEAQDSLAPYSQSALTLAQDQRSWSATRSAGSLEVLPGAISAQVESVLTQLDATEADLAAALTEQFEMTRRASELGAQIQIEVSDVDTAINETDRGLFRVDVAPIWRGLGPSTETGDLLATMQNGLEIEGQFVLDYQKAETSSNQIRRVVHLLLLPLIFWLATRSRRKHPDTTISGHHNHGLSRPISTWILLSTLLFLLLEPDAPILLQETALLLGLVPILRLLPLGTLHAWGAWPYLAVGLYVLDRTGVAFVTDMKFYRLFLLTLNGLTLALTIGILRSLSLAAYVQQHPGRKGAVSFIGWTLVVILITAAGCNIFGNVSMAESLTSGIIDSAYMLILLYLGVSACIVILETLLNQNELARYKLLQRHTPALQLVFKRLLVLGATAVWLIYFMERFRILRPLQGFSTAVLDLGIEVGEVSIQISDLLIFMLSAFLAVWVAKAVRKLLMDELPGHAGLPRGVGNSIASLSYYGLLLLGLLVALSAAGFKVSQLTLVFGALGVGIGFGLQNVVNNFVSGVVLMFERPIQPGDVIETAGISGRVRQISLRATILRTFDGADIVVPNGSLLSSNLTNWTMFDNSRRIEVPVGVAYESNPAKVVELLISAARDTSGVAPQPEPVALLTGYGDSSLDFVTRVWTNDGSSWMSVRAELIARILANLQEAGISIPYQQVDLNLRSVPEPLTTWAGKARMEETTSETNENPNSQSKS